MSRPIERRDMIDDLILFEERNDRSVALRLEDIVVKPEYVEHGENI